MGAPRYIHNSGAPGSVGPGADTVSRITECLRAGGVALLPTDTVYGLAAHPEHPEAVTRLFALKGRPRSVNLPVMVASPEDVTRLGAVVNGDASALMDSRYFPGPLTLAFGLSPELAPAWLRGRDEVAVRMPDDARLLAVLRATGPLLVTSANQHQGEVHEKVPDILATLNGEPDVVIDDGPRATVPSTLVNCNCEPPRVERVGAVSAEEIEGILR
jgi:L-threonylcarbamoyladenylate synthase